MFHKLVTQVNMERKLHHHLESNVTEIWKDSQHCIIKQHTFTSARARDKNYNDCELVEKCASQEDYKDPDFVPDFSDDCKSDRYQ